MQSLGSLGAGGGTKDPATGGARVIGWGRVGQALGLTAFGARCIAQSARRGQGKGGDAGRSRANGCDWAGMGRAWAGPGRSGADMGNDGTDLARRGRGAVQNESLCRDFACFPCESGVNRGRGGGIAASGRGFPVSCATGFEKSREIVGRFGWRLVTLHLVGMFPRLSISGVEPRKNRL